MKKKKRNYKISEKKIAKEKIKQSSKQINQKWVILFENALLNIIKKINQTKDEKLAEYFFLP